MSAAHFDSSKGILSFKLRPQETEEIELPTKVDQRNFRDPAGYLPSKDHGCFVKGISLTNLGPNPVLKCYVDVDEVDWRYPESIAERVPVTHDPELLVKGLFCWWKDNVSHAERDIVNPQLFFLCQGNGTAESQALVFTDILIKHRVPARKAPIDGHLAFEYFFNGEWHLVDPTRNALYLRLDNQSIASAQELIDDPFLILRTHCFGKFRSMDVGRSWRNFALLQVRNAVYEPPVTTTFSEAFRGLDIYPDERMDFRCVANTPVTRVMHKVSVSQRRKSDGSLLYRGLFPIKRVSNNTSAAVRLVGEGLSVEAGEVLDIESHLLFNIHFSCAADDGEIVIESDAARTAVPLLQCGRQKVGLIGEGQREATVQVDYQVDTELLQKPVPRVDVVSIGNVFDHALPSFEVQASQMDMDLLWWQVTRSDEDLAVVSNLDQVIPFTNHISLDRIADSFLSNNVEYRLFVRGRAQGVWGEWSIPFPFRVIKPEPIGDVSFKKRCHKRYEISWEPSASPNVNYHVFGSNSLDFMPDIYYGKRVDRILGAEVTESIDDYNHVIATNDCSITVNGDLAYYRVVAESRGHYSLPSPLIRVYDTELIQERNVLRGSVSENAQFSAERVYYTQEGPIIEESVFTPPEREEARPYLLPSNHPAYARLSRLFRSGRLVATPDSWYGAGFHDAFQGIPSPALMVGEHPELPGYRVKAYFDVQPSGVDRSPLPYCQRLLDRAKGAEMLLQVLKERNYQYLGVPQMWLYLLPSQPLLEPEQTGPSNPCVLIVEDAKLVSPEANLEAYRTRITPSMLDGLVRIISLGIPHLNPDSLRFAEDGRMIFVDTAGCLEGKWRANYNEILPYLSPENAEYWKKIVRRERNRAGVYSGLIEDDLYMEPAAHAQEGYYEDERLCVSYVSRQLFDLSSARRFTVRAIHKILEAVNVDNDKDPYLQGYLFSPVNIGMEITFQDKEGNFVGDEQIAMVMLVKGTIYYDVHRESDGLLLIHKESYEEALEKLKEEGKHD